MASISTVHSTAHPAASTAGVTLEAYAARWLTRVALRLKPRTVETYAANLRLHLLPALGHETPLAAITRDRVRSVLTDKLSAGYGAETVRLMLKVLRALLAEARVEDQVITNNPTERLARLLPPRKRLQADRALSRTTLRRFLRAADAEHPRLGALFIVAARTGLRLGELLGLRWDDVDLERGLVTVRRTLDWRRIAGLPKGGTIETLPLSRQAVASLRVLRGGGLPRCPWIFHGPSGRPWSRTHVWRVMDRACARAEIPHASAHALRHTFVTQLAENGRSAWEIRELARHRSVVTTELYLHLALRHRGAVDTLDD